MASTPGYQGYLPFQKAHPNYVLYLDEEALEDFIEVVIDFLDT
jgi:hypothetical protein